MAESGATVRAMSCVGLYRGHSMPKLWLAPPPAQNCLYVAYERHMRGFSSLTGGQRIVLAG